MIRGKSNKNDGENIKNIRKMMICASKMVNF